MSQRFDSTQSETIRLNNLGASLIDASSYTPAIQILNHALRLVHQQLQCDDEEEPTRLVADSATADDGNEDNVGAETGEWSEWCPGPQPGTSDHAFQMETSSNCSTSATGRSSASSTPTPMALVEKDEEMVEATSSSASSTGEDMEEESPSFGASYVYRTPIRLGSDPAANHHASKTVSTLSLTILFNLALAHHLKGMSNSIKQCQEHLDAGLKLYQICYDLLMEEHRKLNPSLPSSPRSEEDELSSSTCSSDEDCFCWTISQSMGLIHNCGQILQLLSRSSSNIIMNSTRNSLHSTTSRRCLDPTTKSWKTIKADRFFEHLLTSIVMIVECGMANEVENLDDFVRATEHLILSKTSIARAA
jgi:hypothetical protein